ELHHLRRLSAEAPRPRCLPRVLAHEPPLADGEAQWHGGVAVSTPEATAVELALGLHRDPDRGPWLRALLDAFPGLADSARREVAARTRTPGKRAALTALAAAAGQEVVTR
ncbi:MAG: hypothetical protein WA971_00120, partial [Microbacterium sp.]